MEYDHQKQIDRACSAQSPEMLPKTLSNKKLQAAQERVAKLKSQYEVPASSISYES